MASSPPVISGITFDQASYAPGETIHATVTYAPGSSPLVQSFTGSALDSTTELTGTLTVSFTTVISDSTVVKASDTGNRTWTKVSDTGTVAVFAATA
jgi:hypothetical protein